MTKRIIAIVMAKNEEKSIKRVLGSCIGTVDAMFVLDTGSTDNTIDLANSMFSETMPGFCLATNFVDFGTSRTKSFTEARKFTRSLGWKDSETYGLLLDADHEIEVDRFDKNQLVHPGYSCIKRTGDLVYPNIRLVRFDVDWKCRGVVHEYWSGGYAPDLTTITINDHSYEGEDYKTRVKRQEHYRDLLIKGLEDEPNNSRYVFYLAQTHNTLGEKEKAIPLYKRRTTMQGYLAETWYSMYQLSKLHDDLKDKIYWTLQAFVFDNTRAEALYHTTFALRCKGKMREASSMISLAYLIPKPHSALFVEDTVYDKKIPHEMSILAFYGPMRSRGYEISLKYLSSHDDDITLRNLKWYTVTSPPSSAAISIDPDPISIAGGKLFNKAKSVSKKFKVNGKTYVVVTVGGYYSIVNETDKVWSKLVVGLPATHDVNNLEWYPV